MGARRVFSPRSTRAENDCVGCRGGIHCNTISILRHVQSALFAIDGVDVAQGGAGGSFDGLAWNQLHFSVRGAARVICICEALPSVAKENRNTSNARFA